MIIIKNKKELKDIILSIQDNEEQILNFNKYMITLILQT